MIDRCKAIMPFGIYIIQTNYHEIPSYNLGVLPLISAT
jgi:hypothetical protein